MTPGLAGGQTRTSRPAERDGSPASGGRPILTVRNVHKTFDHAWWRPFGRPNYVLRGADLEIWPGRVVGLVGENGSGKSTLMKIIAGALPADRGSVDRPVSFGYCPQEPVLYDKLTVAETFRLFGTAYGIVPEIIEDRTRFLLAELDFERYRSQLVHRLSGGTRQKLNLSIALLHEPRLLLLDEPYTGFDYDTYQHFWGLAETFARDGRSLLVVSHLLHETHRFDTIHEIVDGRLAPRAER